MRTNLAPFKASRKAFWGKRSLFGAEPVLQAKPPKKALPHESVFGLI